MINHRKTAWIMLMLTGFGWNWLHPMDTRDLIDMAYWAGMALAIDYRLAQKDMKRLEKKNPVKGK
jgi:hypothetical protein